MGRMLEVLRKSDRSQPLTVRADGPAAPPLVVEPEAEETIPFIEVGGPRNVLDASPDVLACPAPAPEPAKAPQSAPPTALPSLTMSLFCSWTLPAATDQR